MATETLSFPSHAAGANIYFRLFDESGQVFDFNDNTFKALSAATTPYVAATERADMDGTGLSGYTASVDLASVWNKPTPKRLTVHAYDNATPAATDVAVSGPLSLTVQLGQLGEKDLVAQAEVSVKSTAGLEAQVTAWLEHGGQKVSLGSIGGTVFTAATTDVITSTGHGLADGDVVLLTTSNTLPAGLSTATPYYVRDKTANTFKLAASSGGAAIDITDTGTGTHKWHKATATVTLREHGSAVNLFSKSLTFADLVNHRFEGEQSSPNFTDDRQYEVECSITVEGLTVTSSHNSVVIG